MAREGAKVLVIGSMGHAGAACIDWTQEDIPNIADFHVVIVNTGSLTRIIEWMSREPIKVAEWEAVYDRLRRVKERLLQVVDTQGTVYAIVYPPASVTQAGISQYTSSISSHDWNPLPVYTTKERSDTKEAIAAGFERYFDAVDGCTFYFHVAGSDYFFMETKEKHRGAFRVSAQDQAIAINRQRQAIGLSFAYGLHRYVRLDQWGQPSEWNKEPDWVSGSVFYLPPSTQVSDDDAVRILLEDFCGIEPRTTAPVWAVTLDMPANEELERRIQAKEDKIRNIQEELEPLLTEKERRDGFKAILFETGHPLQDAVEAAFKQLGFATRPSDVSDEFYIEFEGSEALVEVKGHDKSASLDDVRQLIDYQLGYEQKHGRPIKGVLVVSAWRKLPLDERGLSQTPVFPDNVVKRARANGIALLNTVTLFDALNAFWLQKVNTSQLFELLLTTRDVVKLP